MDRLLEEEKIITEALSKYGCLRWEQLIKLIYNKKEETAQRILVGLKKRQLILEDEGSGYVRLDPRTQSDDKMIRAFWILLQYVNKISPREHYPANYPSEIFFLKQGVQYEIVVLNPREEHVLSMLFNENRNNSDDEEDITKYIIVVANTDCIEACLNKIPDKVIDNKQVLFATINYKKDSEIPDIQYYQV